MADMTALDDIDHFWGGDLLLSPTGDLGRCQRERRSKQRVIRRLMTNPGDYPFQPDYGGGLPALIGSLVEADRVRTIIRGQMLLEPSVAPTPEPTVEVKTIANGLWVKVSYTMLPDRQPVALSFEVSA